MANNDDDFKDLGANNMGENPEAIDPASLLGGLDPSALGEEFDPAKLAEAINQNTIAEPYEPQVTIKEEASVATEEESPTVTAQPVQFASFEDLDQVQGPQNQNLNILLDVKLQLSVELGRTELPIKKVLELTKGSIVTLNKAAGEPVELYANGKLIAYGEVVVIEDNFGLRITHITDPAKRLNSLGSTNNQE